MPYASPLLPVVFTLDTLIYAAGDLLADTQVITGAVPIAGGSTVLQSLVLNDKDDQAAAAMTVVLLDSNVSLGTENSAPSITDANADNIVGVVSLVAGDWVDLGGCKVATKTNIGLMCRAASGTTNLYVALITAGTPTQTATGITGRFGFVAAD